VTGSDEHGGPLPGGLVVVRGGGDLGTGVVHRLFRAGYRVLVLETESPTVVRRSVAFAEAVPAGRMVVEDVEARRTTLEELGRSVWTEWVPVVVDPDGDSLSALTVDALVDARMAKVNLGTSRHDAPLTIGLGPGFTAADDVDFVVETKRGHSLGRVIAKGAALPNTGVPGEVGGAGAARVIRAPATGRFEPARLIGDLVREGDTVGTVAGRKAISAIDGILRGLVAAGVELEEGQKLGDVDPRGTEVDHTRISDKARAVGGAVLEALLRGGVLPGRSG
jgi:xanthine dehydrogenase accessory factor